MSNARPNLLTILALALAATACGDKHLSSGRDYLLAGELATATTEFKASVAGDENTVPGRAALLAALVLSPVSSLNASVYVDTAPFIEMGSQKNVPETTREKLTQKIMQVRKSLQESGIRTQDNEDAIKVITASAKEFDPLLNRDWMKQRGDYRGLVMAVACVGRSPLIVEAAARALLAEKRNIELTENDLVIAHFLGAEFFKHIAASADNAEAVDNGRAIDIYRLAHTLDIGRRVFDQQPGPGPRNQPALEGYTRPGGSALIDVLVEKTSVPRGLIDVGWSSGDPDERVAEVRYATAVPTSGPQLVVATLQPAPTQQTSRVYAVQGSHLSDVKIVVKRDAQEQAAADNRLPGDDTMFGFGYDEASATWNFAYWDTELEVVRLSVGSFKDGVLTLTPAFDLYQRLPAGWKKNSVPTIPVLRSGALDRQSMFDIRSLERTREQLRTLFLAVADARLDLHSTEPECYSAKNLSGAQRPANCTGGQPVPTDSAYLGSSSRKTLLPPPVGTRIRVLYNYGNHNYKLGDIVTVAVVDPKDGQLKATKPSGKQGNWLRLDEWELADRTSRRLSDMPAEGTQVRVVRNTIGHNYRLGNLYTVSTIVNATLFKAKNDAGAEGSAMSIKDCETAAGIWAGPYIKPALEKDPWGTPYHIGVNPESGRMVIVSCGPDKVCNGDLPSLRDAAIASLPIEEWTKASLVTEGDDLRVVENNGPNLVEAMSGEGGD